MAKWVTGCIAVLASLAAIAQEVIVLDFGELPPVPAWLDGDVELPTGIDFRLIWTAPEVREDGSLLTEDEILNYTLYYRANEDSWQTIVVDDPSVKEWLITNLPPAIWQFKATVTANCDSGPCTSAESVTLTEDRR